MNRKYISIYIIGIIVSLVFGYYIGYYATIQKVEKQISQEQQQFYVVLRINVYDKNHKLIKQYAKVGDPPVINFLYFLYRVLWKGTPTQEFNTTIITGQFGTSYTVSDTNPVYGYDLLRICVGNGTSPVYSINAYNLQSEVGYTSVTVVGCFYNSTHMWILFRGSWTNTGADVNITEVGLKASIYFIDTAGTYHYPWCLIFYDVLPSPILVPASGSITITYYIYIRYG